MRKRGAHTSGAPMPEAWEAVGRMGAEDPPSLPGGPPTGLGVVYERAIGGPRKDDFPLNPPAEPPPPAAHLSSPGSAAATRPPQAAAPAALPHPPPPHTGVA